MTGNRQTLVDALNAEMLGDMQKMHVQLTLCTASIQALKETQCAMSDAAVHMRNTLDGTATQFEIMAKGILMFARDEQKSAQIVQREEQVFASELIFNQVKAVTARFDKRLWLLASVSSFNLLVCIATLFLIKG